MLVLVWGADSRGSADPTAYAFGARSFALGTTVVAVGDDANALQANPAVLGATQKLQVGLSSYQLLNEYKFLNIVSIVPTPYGYFGVTYFSYSVDGIPDTGITQEGNDETTLRIYKDGEYAFSERILGLSYGGRIEEDFFGNLTYGLTGKLVNSTLANESLTGFGLDAGVRFDVDMLELPFIENTGKLTIGLAIQNLLPPTFVSEEEEEKSTSAYQMNMRLGAAAPFSVWGQNFIAAGDLDGNGFHTGLEYLADKSLRFRAGLDGADSSFGVGYRLLSLRGFDGKPYSLALDYAYRFFDKPFDSVHYVSITLLGALQTKTPQIVTTFEQINVTADAIDLSGLAEPAANVNIYVNQRLRKTVPADGNGVWNIANIPLDQGQNDIHATAQYEQYMESGASALLTLYADRLQPVIKTTLRRDNTDGDFLQISVTANKEVTAVVSRIGEETVILKKSVSGNWLGEWEIPVSLNNTNINLRTIAVDALGNRSKVVEDVFSTKFISSPRDRTITAQKNMLIRGVAQPGTVRVESGEFSVVPSADGRFILPIEVPLEGKNLIQVGMVGAEGQTVSVDLRVLRVREADDLQGFVWARNQVTSILTLGALDSSGARQNRFRPEDYLQRQEFAKAIAVLKDLPLLADPVNVAADVSANNEFVPYIKAVLDAEYMELLPEGFAPQAFILRKDAVSALVKMENLDIESGARQIFRDVPLYMSYAAELTAAVDAGIVSRQDNFYPDRPLTRVDAAVWLAALPEAQSKTNEMYDWKQGYGPQFEEDPLASLSAAERQMLAGVYVNGRLVAFESGERDTLKVLAPLDRSIADRQQIEVNGIVKEGTQVTINGVPVPVANGAFLARLSLSEGRNIISVEGARQTQLVRVMYVRPFIDKQGAAADNLKYNLSRQYVNYARFDGDQPITRGEIQLILNGLKGTTGGNTTSSENITYRDAVRLLNSWDGRPADAVEITEGVLDSGQPLTRDQFINLLANTATYKSILARNNDFEDYAETAAKIPACKAIPNANKAIRLCNKIEISPFP
ncbi:hypothetical protein NO2_1063 [Candidatus Termititenax persephonae]|uniref:SLH domain-containing protein n=1 Tax=Candidatus Termititenax persephonae TaxID=2218525 RepID=A0A388TI01_9BACT|nr:hypothetical protein NO2_1063 [Candidatus Termititenax persephonae]